MDKEFNNTLDECLERLLVKSETIEQCLQSYPEQASELKPLLETALAAKQASDIQPGDEFRARARYQLQAALVEATSPKSRPAFGWLPRWATVITIVLGLLLVGSGTVMAAGYSMPDSPLYPVKLAAEQVQLTLTPSTMNKAELHAKLADRRVIEIIYLANKGDARRIETITQRLDERLVMLTGLASVLAVEGAPQVEIPLPAAAPTEEAEVLAPPTAAPAPQVTVQAPPAPQVTVEAPPAAPAEDARGHKDVPAEMNNRAKLRTKVAHYAANHPAALRAMLEKAPESAKPALLRAITIAEARYQQALEAAGD